MHFEAQTFYYNFPSGQNYVPYLFSEISSFEENCPKPGENVSGIRIFQRWDLYELCTSESLCLWPMQRKIALSPQLIGIMIPLPIWEIFHGLFFEDFFWVECRKKDQEDVWFFFRRMLNQENRNAYSTRTKKASEKYQNRACIYFLILRQINKKQTKSGQNWQTYGQSVLPLANFDFEVFYRSMSTQYFMNESSDRNMT